MTTSETVSLRAPEKKFSAGAISASVWKNSREVNGEAKDIRSVQFQKSYKDSEGNWQKTNSLDVRDLPKAMIVLGKAFEYLSLKEV